MNPTATEENVQLNEIVKAAEAAYQSRDFPTVERLLINALDQSPQRVDLRFLLGHTYMERGDFESALACYNEIARTVPNLSPVHSSRALALQLMGRTDLAKAAAEQALQLAPDDPVALKVLVRIHLNAGQGERSRQYGLRLLALDVRDVQARQMLAEAEALCERERAKHSPPPLANLDHLRVSPLEVSLPAAVPQRPANGADADWQEEISFWDKELSLTGLFAADMAKRLREPEKVFPSDVIPYIEELSQKHGRRPRVLDAGCGPLPYLAYGHLSGKMELVGADPLAEVYLQLLAKHGHQPTAPLVKCKGEELTRVFGVEAFDLIYMKNALDHCQSPREVFQQMVQALRPGGYIFILGTVKEATRQNWAGLHQHDLYQAPGGRLMDQHKAGGRLITECISDSYGLEVVKANPPTDVSGQWLSIIWRKPEITVPSPNRHPNSPLASAGEAGGAGQSAATSDQAGQRFQQEWKELIWPFIQDCDFSSVLDLAAGHGRSSEKLGALAQRIYVADVNEESVAFCRRRFAGDNKFTFIRNNGVTLDQVPDNSLTLVYCFGAMVRFDSDIVRHYLREFRRILKPGGRGFCHHSNTVKYPGTNAPANPDRRSFMSQPLFAHYCAKEGLILVRSRIMDWDGRPDSDCFSLFRKP